MLQKSHFKPIITLPGSPSPQGVDSLPDTGLLHTRPTWEAEAGSPPLKRLVRLLSKHRDVPRAGWARRRGELMSSPWTKGLRRQKGRGTNRLGPGGGAGRPNGGPEKHLPGSTGNRNRAAGGALKTPDTQAPIPGGTTCGPEARATRNRGSGPAASPRQPPDQACPPTVGLGVRPKLVLGGSGECVCVCVCAHVRERESALLCSRAPGPRAGRPPVILDFLWSR